MEFLILLGHCTYFEYFFYILENKLSGNCPAESTENTRTAFLAKTLYNFRTFFFRLYAAESKKNSSVLIKNIVNSEINVLYNFMELFFDFYAEQEI